MMGIYKITNIMTGKYYIGSSKNLFLRWSKHVNELTYDKHHSYKLQEDWNKYGFEYFTFQIIEIITNKDLLLKKEQRWINEEDFENLYNVMTSTSYKSISNHNEFINHINFIKNMSIETKSKLKENILIHKKSGKLLEIGKKNYDLSKTWYSKNNKDIHKVKNAIINYLSNIKNGKSKDIAWTTFTQYYNQMAQKGIKKSFVPLNGEVENDNKRNILCFSVNCFPNSFIKNQIKINVIDDEYALSILLNWIIKVSNINKPIHICILSNRMEKLLYDWLK